MGHVHDNEGTAFRFVMYGFLVICLFFAFRLIYKITRDYYIAKFKANAPEFRTAKSTSSTTAKSTEMSSQLSSQTSETSSQKTPTSPPVTKTFASRSSSAGSLRKNKGVGIAAMPLYFKV